MPKIGTPPAHTHAGAGVGGQLDWDQVWSDAAHSHESAAEGSVLHRYQRILRTGNYIAPWPYQSIGTVALIANRLRAHPFLVPRPITLDRLAVEVTGGGGAGTVLRLGVYADGVNIYPGALVRDVGTVAVNAAAVVAATITGGLSLTSGLYWLAYLGDGTPTVRQANLTISPFGLQTASLSTADDVWSAVLTYGALPDPYPSGAGSTAGAACVVPRLLTLD